MGFQAHGFDTLRRWFDLEPWEQDLYYHHFLHHLHGDYEKKKGNVAEERAKSNEAWRRFVADRAQR